MNQFPARIGNMTHSCFSAIHAQRYASDRIAIPKEDKPHTPKATTTARPPCGPPNQNNKTAPTKNRKTEIPTHWSARKPEFPTNRFIGSFSHESERDRQRRNGASVQGAPTGREVNAETGSRRDANHRFIAPLRLRASALRTRLPVGVQGPRVSDRVTTAVA